MLPSAPSSSAPSSALAQPTEAEIALRQSEERFRALVDASAQIVWTVDSRGRVTEDSPSWREYTGRSYEQSRNWGWIHAVHPDDREHTIQCWREAVAHSQPMETEFRVRHHSNEWHWMQVRAVPLFDEQGAVRGWVGMNIDIEERKQAEAERKRLVRSLFMAEQEERRRISQVLHDDLQQLLYATQMRVAMLTQELQRIGNTQLAQDAEEAYDWIRESINTTRQLTVELSPPILKNEGLADALEWLLPQMERRYGLKVTLHAEGNLRTVDQDLRVLLFQIVRELLFNVAKHSGVDRAVVELQQEGDLLSIYVIDEGQGFHRDRKAKSNISGDKGSNSTSSEGGLEMAGVGLFFVQERLRLVGGDLEIQSQPGGGSRVIVRVPVQAEEVT